MKQVSFQNLTQYEFAVQFLQPITEIKFNSRFQAEELAITTGNPVIGRLLERISGGYPVVLPYFSNKEHAWIITAINRRELDYTLARVSRFLVPTYAEFAGTEGTPELKKFDANGNQLQRLGNLLYPAGYYSLRSPVAHREIILKRLDLWLNLESQQPILQVERQPTYNNLYERFNASLAATHWQEAEQCLETLQRLNLSTADNLAFLRIQFLAQQQRWSDIWNRTDFPDLARINMPSAVRAALLTAFHHHELLSLEQQGHWSDAITVFQQARPKLGKLLTGRMGLTGSGVVRVFAYQAIIEKNRTALVELRKLDSTLETQLCLDQLQNLLEPEEPAAVTISLSPLQLAQQALASSDYDTAAHFAEEVEPISDRALLLLQIVRQGGDPSVAEKALLWFWELPQDEQTHLQNSQTFVSHSLIFAQILTGVTPKANEFTSSTYKPPTAIQNWLEWFDQTGVNPNTPELLTAVECLSSISDEEFWTLERITLLSEKLLTFIDDPNRNSHNYAKTAVRRLIDLFLQDSRFPRQEEAYIELYETLYYSLSEKVDKNLTTGLTLLRLAEAVLRQKPVECHRFYEYFKDWCTYPIPAFENWILEVFDLLAEYGLEPNKLTVWYRQWVEYLLNLPGNRERTNLETWLAFGRWIQPGPDLLAALEQAISIVTDQEVEDPIANLPPGYRIGIFSLHQATMDRAKELLLARNPNLNIRTCAERDLNEQAKSLAQNSDLVVIVTTCISHALTYGIGPYLKKEQGPVYPQSKGTTSIIRAIESYLLTN
ncbi:MAG: hypothetical protein HXX20_00040 [Chloroflexi bacterium]|nr:hypothetical protein [Chloroflexota bacterium]